jgi:WD40 repeat protein
VLLVVVASLLFFPHARQPPQIPQRLWSVCFSPDGNMLVTGGGSDSPDIQPQGGELVLWDAKTGEQKRITGQEWAVRSAVFSSDGKFIAMADFGGTTRLVDPTTGKIRAALTPHQSQINAVVVSPDSKLIAGGSFDGTISLWDATGKELGTLEAPGQQILNLAISPDGQRLAATSRGGNAYLFDLAQRNPPKVLQAYVGPPSYWSGVEAVAFAPDGKSFVTGGMTLRLWETETGNLIGELAGGSARVNCMAFSPDGHLLAGVDRDGWLAMWDPPTGDRIRFIRAHHGSSFGLAFSPDGQRLATVARDDFVVKIWNSKTLELVRTFHRGT